MCVLSPGLAESYTNCDYCLLGTQCVCSLRVLLRVTKCVYCLLVLGTQCVYSLRVLLRVTQCVCTVSEVHNVRAVSGSYLELHNVYSLQVLLRVTHCVYSLRILHVCALSGSCLLCVLI